MFNFDHPWFEPYWRRILVVAVCLGWAVVEGLTGAPMWAALFGAAGGYAAWRLLFAYPTQDD